MNVVEKATGLVARGFAVFPVDEKSHPLTQRGHNDATTDAAIIPTMFKGAANVGINCGLSGVVVLDIDMKNGKNGYVELENAWLEVPETFSYNTRNNGEHLIYRVPEDAPALNQSMNYRGMHGVDRKAGSSYVVWWGGMPDEEIAVAPRWLLDPARVRTVAEYEGDLEQWLDDLPYGPMSLRVQDAVNRIPDDMAHDEMVSALYNAIRLGGEGNSGVPELLAAIKYKWMTRPEENHTTPFTEWEHKYHEALTRGVEMFGATLDQINNLPPYDLDKVPQSVPVESTLLGSPGRKYEFDTALRELAHVIDDEDIIATTLWNAPVTKEYAVYKGIEYVYGRIKVAKMNSNQVVENPAIPEVPATSVDTTLLTAEENEHLDTKIESFADVYIDAARRTGFTNEEYARSCAWTVLSLAFGTKGFIPVSSTDKMGLNLWNITLGESGTGKSRSLKFMNQILNGMFEEEDEDGNQVGTSSNLGADSSPEGMHIALLQRDKQPSALIKDEASSFFKQIRATEWMNGIEDTLAHWYEGRVDPSNKISLKELKGKSARTSFNIQMFATPDKLTELINRDMFLTGFMARFSWGVGSPREDTDDRFNLKQELTPTGYYDNAAEVEEILNDLLVAREGITNPIPLLATSEALRRMSKAYRDMYRRAEGKENWDIIEPSITRLHETMRKIAGLSAMYRGDDTIRLNDALIAIRETELYYGNLFKVAGMIVAGEFQRDCDQIETWLGNRGTATQQQLFHQFRNLVSRSSRELIDRLEFLVNSGRVVRKSNNGTITYKINGGNDE